VDDEDEFRKWVRCHLYFYEPAVKEAVDAFNRCLKDICDKIADFIDHAWEHMHTEIIYNRWSYYSESRRYRLTAPEFRGMPERYEKSQKKLQGMMDAFPTLELTDNDLIVFPEAKKNYELIDKKIERKHQFIRCEKCKRICYALCRDCYKHFDILSHYLKDFE